MIPVEPAIRASRARNPHHLVRLFGGALILLVLGAASFFSAFYLYRPMGTGPAGPEVPRELFAEPWTDRPVRLIGLGDSVTAGYGASMGHSYFQRLVKNPPNEFPEMQGISLQAVLPNLKADNRSVSGSTSLEHWQRQLPRLPTAPPDTFGLVVMTTGGNDIIHDYGRSAPREGAMFGATYAQAEPWIANFERRLEQMTERIQASFPGGCRIFLANIYDPTDGEGVAKVVGLPHWPDAMKIHAAYNAVLRRFAEAHPQVDLVDIHGPMLGHGIHCRQFWKPYYQRHDPHHWFYDNFEDPNDRGYDAIRRLFLVEIARYRDEIGKGWTSGAKWPYRSSPRSRIARQGRFIELPVTTRTLGGT